MTATAGESTSAYFENVSLNQENRMGDVTPNSNSQAIINMSGRAVSEEIPNRKTCNLVAVTVTGIFFTGCFGCGAGAYLFFESSRKLMVVYGDPDAQFEFYLGVVLLALSFFTIFKTTVAREFTDSNESNRAESVV